MKKQHRRQEELLIDLCAIYWELDTALAESFQYFCKKKRSKALEKTIFLVSFIFYLFCNLVGNLNKKRIKT